MIWRLATMTSLFLLSTTAGASAEGFLDFLLGAQPPAAQASTDAGAITVHRRHARPRPAHRVSVARADPGKPTDVAIDPTKVADWYLKDRTLRRGDIIVLKSGALVFMGGHGDVRTSDFASLRESRGIPAKTRAFVLQATAANAYTAAAAAPPKPEVKRSAARQRRDARA